MPFRTMATLAAVAMAAGGTGDTADRPVASDRPDNTLTVYSRDRAIAEPLFEQFERETGIDVRARYGDPIILAGQIIEDGADSPADVFYGPLSDALGALSAAGRLATLSEEQLDRVPRPTARPEAFHCHNLEHEDMAMMVNFYIV